MTDDVQLRVHGTSEQPTLVYLPGLHGDWTLVGNFRRALAGRVRFVECAYPRTTTWSLAEHAAAVESALGGHGIRQAWILAESFGSQVLWALMERNRFVPHGVILAGGFVRHPMQWGAALGAQVAGTVSLRLIKAVLLGYAKAARFRYRHCPEVTAEVKEFIARRGIEEDRQAARHRLRLVSRNDPCHVAARARVPIYVLSGLIDPIVPWFFVRPWLKRHCGQLREYKIILRADHNVLGTAPEASAAIVLQWMQVAQVPSAR